MDFVGVAVVSFFHVGAISREILKSHPFLVIVLCEKSGAKFQVNGLSPDGRVSPLAVPGNFENGDWRHIWNRDLLATVDAARRLNELHETGQINWSGNDPVVVAKES